MSELLKLINTQTINVTGFVQIASIWNFSSSVTLAKCQGSFAGISSHTPFTSKGKNAVGKGCMCESAVTLQSFQKMQKPDLSNKGERDCEL